MSNKKDNSLKSTNSSPVKSRMSSKVQVSKSHHDLGAEITMPIQGTALDLIP